jgi:hypothetical protein
MGALAAPTQPRARTKFAMKTLKFAPQSILPVLTVSALMLTASLAICNPAHATEHGKAPKASSKSSASAQPTTASKSITAPKPEINFRGVLLGVPGQVGALKELCLSDANEKIAEASKQPEDPSIGNGKLDPARSSDAKLKLTSAHYDIDRCEKEIKAEANGLENIFRQFSLHYANLRTQFSLRSSSDGAVLQLSGHVTDDVRAALLILLGERFGSPQVKTITYQNRLGAKYDFHSFAWSDSKSNTIEVTPNDKATGYLIVFKAGAVGQKRADEILDAISSGRSKM